MIVGETPTALPAVPVLVNSSAGLNRAGVVDRVAAALDDAGVLARLEVMQADELQARVAQLRAEGADVVAVAGGDGTLLGAAAELAGGPTTLAPLPTGTLNHFARRLGLHDLPTAVRAVREGTIGLVSLGVVDDRVFLNTATFGVYADMVRRRERFRKPFRKWPAAVVAFALTMIRVRAMDVTLLVDGSLHERKTSLVWVGLGWGSFPFVHQTPERRAKPDLEIVILKGTDPLKWMALLFRLGLRARSRARPVQDRALEVMHAQQLLIQADRRIGVTLDGEVLRCEPPIFIAVQQDALRVVTPAIAPLPPGNDDGEGQDRRTSGAVPMNLDRSG